MKRFLFLLLSLLAGLAHAQRVEWTESLLLVMSGAGRLVPKGARLEEWGRDGRRGSLALQAERLDKERWSLRPERAPDLRAQHAVVLRDGSRLPLIPGAVLDSFQCDQPLGMSQVDGVAVFRLFAPRARAVRLHLYAAADAPEALLSREALPAADGSWSVGCPEAGSGMAWTWSLDSATGVADWTDPALEFADPWATAVATRNDHDHAGRALIVDESHPWQATDWRPPHPSTLVILEAHLRDLTCGPGAGAGALAGSYPGFSGASAGGLAHLRDLGVSAVQFLPLQDFGNIEPDFDSPATPVRNTWNPWERNHWGYMTSYFLAPESYYGSGQSLRPGGWCGLDGRQARELKELVDRCHQAGIAVILDVVYNHVSQYDRNPLKCLDMAYWFRLGDDGVMSSASGCGNDLATERPLVRRLILDSVRHFADEYRVDGFRFDLGAMLDDETLVQVRDVCATRGLYLTAEPWGGGRYEPERFARLGWAWWNDQYRVDLRGRHPAEGAGFLFGRLHGESSIQRLALGVQGYRREAGGPNPDPLQSTNYVAAHDDHDLGDWIKLGLGLADEERPVADRLAYQTLTAEELALHGVAALHLLSSAGVPMIHSGQELGRSKLIAAGNRHETRSGRVDHNSYEKDNATNWIDWRLKSINAPLVELYRQAVAFRRGRPALATAPRTLLGEPTGARLAWTSVEARTAAAFNTDPAAEWRLPLPGQGALAVVSGEARLEEGTLVLGPRSAALVEWQP
ncbi:MAG: alpha-amylase family glycosyl hydrolase [bacterium]|nr:alpha-amylase family glycosyl hydrolase [bacterium]